MARGQVISITLKMSRFFCFIGTTFFIFEYGYAQLTERYLGISLKVSWLNFRSACKYFTVHMNRYLASYQKKLRLNSIYRPQVHLWSYCATKPIAMCEKFCSNLCMVMQGHFLRTRVYFSEGKFGKGVPFVVQVLQTICIMSGVL